MGSIIIREFHEALNAVTQPTTKPVGVMDSMQNVIVSTRNTVAKKPGYTPINSVAYGGGEEVLSIFDYLLQQGDIVRSTIFQQGTNLYAVHHQSGVAGVIKSGLTPQEFQYTVSGSTVYMGNRVEMLKYYAIAGYALFADLAWNITDGTRNSLAESFISEHGKARNCASISIPLQRVGTIPNTTKVTIEIQGDSGGEPDGAAIANGVSNQIDGDDITSNWAWTAFTFGATLPILSPGVTYWIVLKTSAVLTGGALINWGTDSTSPDFNDGNFSVFDTVWVDQPNTVGLFHVFVEPDQWGIFAPTTAPDVVGPAVNNPAYETPGDQDADEELIGIADLSAELAQSWEFTGTDERTVSGVQLYLKKTGLPLGSLQVVIRSDVDGRPSEAALIEFPVVLMSDLTGSYGFVTFTANEGEEITLRPNTRYWLHLSGGITYLNEFVTGVTSVSWGVDASSPTFATGEFARAPGVRPWDVDNTIDALFRITSSLSSAGGRKYSYSWKNSVTGHVSNPSPASARAGNLDSVTIDNFEAPTDPQIDLLILWATTDGGEIFFQLDEQPEDTASIVDGPVTEDDLDFTVEAPFCNFPPNKGNIISRAKDSIIISGVRSSRHRAFYSAGLGQTLVGVPEESFPAFNFVGVPGGSEPIYNIDSIDGNPVIFTTDQIFTIAGETPESFRAQEMRGGKGIGSVSKRGSVATEIGLLFMSTDRKVYLLPTISHIPQLISQIVEDSFENITSDSSLLVIRSMEKIRMEYLAYADRHWVLISIPTGPSDINNELWMYDIDLHNIHPGRGWMGPLINDGAEGFQSMKVVTASDQTKTLFFGTDNGFIGRLGVGNQDDGANFTSSATFPFMDDNKPNTVKDWLTVEVIVPAGQTVPSNFLQVSYDSETDFITIPLVQVNEMEREDSDHKYRGYLMRHSTRIKPRINFAVEDAVGELWQLRLDYNDLYETTGLIHDANA